MSMTDHRTGADRHADGPMTVVVDPGQPPYRVPPVLEVRGPLTAGRVAAALDQAAARTPGNRTWRHRIQRLGPGHHLLHVEPRTAGTAPDDAHHGREDEKDAHHGPDAFPAGLVADLLTASDTPAVPLGPAQLDLVRRRDAEPGLHPWRALDTAEPLDPATVDSALRALARAHPLLGARIDTEAGGIHAAPLGYEAECTTADGVGRARERGAVAEASRHLDPATGRTLRAVLLRGRRRLVVVAHELVADRTSMDVLLADLRAALAGPGEEPAAEGVRYTDWVAALPALAAAPRETERWRVVAEGRAAASAFRPRAPLPAGTPQRHPGFTLSRSVTGRLTGPLPRRYGLSPAQLLTGAVGLALIRWRGTASASFDVRTDGRRRNPALARTVGPLVATEPVLLDGAGGGNGADGESARGFIGRVAGHLADVGGGAFGACREYAPDPALRLALRELVPVLVRFTPDADTDADLRGAPAARSYALDIDARERGGRLCVGLGLLPAARDGVTEESAARLLAELKAVLAELAGDAGAAPAAPATVAASPLQRELLADADAHPGSGRQIEQLTWVWHGALDVTRFTAAWQSVFDREAVLRTAFDHGPDPTITLHDRVTPEVVRVDRTGAHPADVFAGDRRRGLDPRSPGPLRITLLDGPLGGGARGSGPDGDSARGGGAQESDPRGDGPHDLGAPAPSTRVLLTYHQALLDTWSVRLLLEEFGRAYLADGALPGGDRRPDVRDHARWIEGQDLAPARDFWLRVAPRTPAASSLAAYATASPLAEGTGTERARVRLASAEAARLKEWAARWGATESGALQAAWALLLYRAAGADGPVPVRFSVTVSGRGIPLEGAERLPGALRNPLPVSVEVDPGATVPDLLAALRDRAIDLSSYEWVSAGQIHDWAGTAPGGSAGAGRSDDSLLVFENGSDPLEKLELSFAAHGIRMEFPEVTGAATAFPVTLLSHHDEAGGLVLSVNHDRGRLTDATGLLAHCAGLLRELPYESDESTSIADFLDQLPVTAATWPAFVTLRPGTGGVICLVPSQGVPRTWYSRLARLYAGPETLILLRPSPEGARAWCGALRTMAEGGKRLVLGAFSGGGAGAYETARLLAADGGRPPLVVLTAGIGTEDAVGHLVRLLDEAARRPDGD
ncbi:condensation domain-containing protein [Streptomyces sp. NPDC057137]|uniref:condensation domain-containing protein n=1 Tax=Streptomyces sp. NPDC057137 TaxID=3346030 RepID=UPI003628FF50